MQLNTITAVILAAGSSKRLRPLTDNLPKCLLPIKGDKTILDLQLEALRRRGIRNIYIVIGYLGQCIRDHVSNHHSKSDVTYVENSLYESRNNFYSLALFAEQHAHVGNVLQINSDVVFDPRVLTLLRENNLGNSYIFTRADRCEEEEMKVLLNSDGTVARLNKNLNPTQCLGEGVGINWFAPPFWRAYAGILQENKENYSQEYFEYGMEKAIEAGNKIYPLDIGSLEAVEVDFSADLNRARDLKFLDSWS